MKQNEIFVGDRFLQTIKRSNGEEFQRELVVSFKNGIILLGNSSLGSEVSSVIKPRLEMVGDIYSCFQK